MKKKFATGLVMVALVATTVLAGCASGDKSKPATGDPKAGSGTAAKTATKFPTKGITILNSSAAGSPTDVMAREVARQAEKTLGQSMTIVNATGGSGGVMMAKLLKEPADGYTIAGITAAQIAALQGDLKKDFKFDDFEFLVNVQKEPYAIAVSADSKFKTIKEMMDYAKANPGKLKVGGQGTGSSLHLIMLQLAEASGATITWVPFGGGSESVTALLGNNVDVISTAPATVNQYVEAKKIRVLAITGDQRMANLADTPTLKELGFNDITATQYRGFFAKKGIPADVKAKLVDALAEAVRTPDFIQYMSKNNQPRGFMSPEDFTSYAKKDFEQVGQLTSKYMK